MTRSALAAVLMLALAGCATGEGAYPSLAPRGVEKQGFGEPDTAVAVAAPDPALDARLAPLAARLDAVAKGFASDAAAAERNAVAAKGKPAGSEAWLTAQTALASLDDWRAQTSALATDIEQIGIERGAALAPDYPALTALGARADAEAARQSGTIARLQAMLAPA
ncbi:hypothetical protein [Sphingomonas sp.]|uniref:hypothetical protein n=1 Tax=Sphingomonas sp. TaxID=28214 RepID=UPI0035BBF368